ncbi:hypothetical protein [Spirosoma panaciterrae]|uniref:hypothetical protein n=1 Tax=Spirosoma panaciterrae TaxID=496058 RepID=UPI001B7FA1F1|nr:hypothetical protein [Spirosoma panaciterrae]
MTKHQMILKNFLQHIVLPETKKLFLKKLEWFETTLQFALNVNDETVKSAFPSLYLKIANCYEELKDPIKA